jgi:hypothetical protein
MEYWNNGFSRFGAFSISGGQRLKIGVYPAFIPSIPFFQHSIIPVE